MFIQYILADERLGYLNISIHIPFSISSRQGKQRAICVLLISTKNLQTNVTMLTTKFKDVSNKVIQRSILGAEGVVMSIKIGSSRINLPGNCKYIQHRRAQGSFKKFQYSVFYRISELLETTYVDFSIL